MRKVKVGDWIVVSSEVELEMSPFLRGKVFQVDSVIGLPRYAPQVGFSAIARWGVPVRMWVLTKRVTKLDVTPIINQVIRRTKCKKTH